MPADDLPVRLTTVHPEPIQSLHPGGEFNVAVSSSLSRHDVPGRNPRWRIPGHEPTVAVDEGASLDVNLALKTRSGSQGDLETFNKRSGGLSVDNEEIEHGIPPTPVGGSREFPAVPASPAQTQMKLGS